MMEEIKKFIWTDDLVKEYIEYLQQGEGCGKWHPMEEFKKSKEVKKDYEILSFTWTQRNPQNLMWVLQENGMYRNNYGSKFSYESMMYGNDGSHCVENGKMKIHSVKRLR